MLLKSNTEAPGEEVVRKTPPFTQLNQAEKPLEDVDHIWMGCVSPFQKDGALMLIPTADVVDGSFQSAVMESKNVNTASGPYGQPFFHGGGVYNTTTTQEFGTDQYYTSGRYDNKIYGNGTLQKFSNTGALDTWRTNGCYLDRVSSFYITF